MLQILFGDDEHTASDGAYPRLMKARKWLYLSSALAFVSAHQLYRPLEMEAFLKVVVVPAWLVHNAAVIGTAYLLGQYSLLLIQLISSYDITLKSRFAFRRADDAASAAERLSSAKKRMLDARSGVDPLRDEDLTKLFRSYDRWDERERSVRNLISDLKKRTGQMQAELTQEAVAAHNAEIRRAERALERAVSGKDRAKETLHRSRFVDVNVSPERREVEDEYFKAEEAYREIRSEDPASRWLYRASEVAIDLARLVTPAIAGGSSLILLWKIYAAS